MKIKLKKFTAISKSILPNEAHYLTKIANFQDAEKNEIFNRVIENATSQNTFKTFDENIDKRKYNYIKTWIAKKLELIDVDRATEWIMRYKMNILTDTITSQEEHHLLNYLSSFKDLEYNFQNLFELALEYRSYLLIRMRYKDHNIINQFIENFTVAYEKSKKINQKLYIATTEITKQYSNYTNETKYWEKWLSKVFNTQSIDGKNRYQAFILMAFMYTNYNDHARLKKIFDEIDHYFSNGEMYSRRLLCNYYASRLLLHSKINELERAEYFGLLSIRQDNDDTLLYVNNLIGILIKNHKHKQAFKLLERFRKLYESTHNYHQKTSYISYNIRLLAHNNQLLQAENIGRHFLKKHDVEILKHRWHHFFTSYFNVLLAKEKYYDIITLFSKYNLEEKELERSKKSNYIPNLSWCYALAKYMEGKINDTKLYTELIAPTSKVTLSQEQQKLILETIEKYSEIAPEIFTKLKSEF
jgi:hypothetical protein